MTTLDIIAIAIVLALVALAAVLFIIWRTTSPFSRLNPRVMPLRKNLIEKFGHRVKLLEGGFWRSGWLALAFALLALSAHAQTNLNNGQPIGGEDLVPIPLNFSWLTNLPSASSFQSAKFGLGLGAGLKSGAVENQVTLDGYFKTNWVLRLAIENAPSATVLDSLGLGGGYRFAWPHAEAYGLLMGKRTFSVAGKTPASWQGDIVVGGSWDLIPGGIIKGMAETHFITDPHSSFSQSPQVLFVVGAKMLF